MIKSNRLLRDRLLLLEDFVVAIDYNDWTTVVTDVPYSVHKVIIKNLHERVKDRSWQEIVLETVRPLQHTLLVIQVEKDFLIVNQNLHLNSLDIVITVTVFCVWLIYLVLIVLADGDWGINPILDRSEVLRINQVFLVAGDLMKEKLWEICTDFKEEIEDCDPRH